MEQRRSSANYTAFLEAEPLSGDSQCGTCFMDSQIPTKLLQHSQDTYVEDRTQARAPQLQSHTPITHYNCSVLAQLSRPLLPPTPVPSFPSLHPVWLSATLSSSLTHSGSCSPQRNGLVHKTSSDT
jgi:hypothetical protein